MPVEIGARLKGIGWSSSCTILHVRPSSVVIRTERGLVPGEVVELEFDVSEMPIRLTGTVDLGCGEDHSNLLLIEQCDQYRDFCQTLTLVQSQQRQRAGPE